ncbi:ABC transporter permease [Paenibacillus cellulositrophicus]|uniref:ABC transporter permease n=1 Tax=Paenibacillus cellulositrophicus TaxID=562959 RepID=UPI00142F1B77|nr:ABC transporter permease [Paenibacillus cellulositrophicus]
MLKLISLELRKYRFSRHIGYAAMAGLAILLFLTLLGITDYGAEDYAFSTFAGSFMLIDTFVRATFMIFAGVLLSTMIALEYRNKTMGVLFTYPIKRRKLIAAKLVIIFVFTFGMILLTDVLMGSVLVVVDRFYPFITDSLTMEQARELLLEYTVSSLSAAAMALIPLLFGMRKHSVTTTMVSSILLVLIVCSGFNGPVVSIESIIAIHLALGAAGLCIAWLSMHRLETKDVN